MSDKKVKAEETVMDEFQCLMSIPNLGDYVDRWIALVGDEVVAVGDTGAEVYRVSREKYPEAMPMVLKVPSDRVMLL